MKVILALLPTQEQRTAVSDLGRDRKILNTEEKVRYGKSQWGFKIWLKQLSAGFDTVMRPVQEIYVAQPGEKVIVRGNGNTTITIAGEGPICKGNVFTLREDGIVYIADKLGYRQFYCRAIICSRNHVSVPDHLRCDFATIRAISPRQLRLRRHPNA